MYQTKKWPEKLSANVLHTKYTVFVHFLLFRRKELMVFFVKISFFGHFQREYVWKENWSWKPCSQYPKKRANIAVALSLTAEQFEFIWNCGNLHNKVKLNGKKLPYVSTYHGIVVVQYPNGTCKKNPSYQPYITEDSSEFLAKVNAIFLLFSEYISFSRHGNLLKAPLLSLTRIKST